MPVFVRHMRLPAADVPTLACIRLSSEHTVIAGGYAVAAFHNFQMDSGDIDVFTSCSSTDLADGLKRLGYTACGASSSLQYVGGTPTPIDAVAKFHHIDHKDVDVVTVAARDGDFTTGILDGFDLGCCKVAMTLLRTPQTLHKRTVGRKPGAAVGIDVKFTVHPDFYTTTYKLDEGSCMRDNTLRRVAKYEARGFKLTQIEHRSVGP
jgi:hypothetical protein